MKLKTADRKKLNEWGRLIGVQRTFWEKIPFIGNKIFRKRILKCWKSIGLK